jgi:hypothetical protein
MNASLSPQNPVEMQLTIEFSFSLTFCDHPAIQEQPKSERYLFSLD